MVRHAREEQGAPVGSTRLLTGLLLAGIDTRRQCRAARPRAGRHPFPRPCAAGDACIRNPRRNGRARRALMRRTDSPCRRGFPSPAIAALPRRAGLRSPGRGNGCPPARRRAARHWHRTATLASHPTGTAQAPSSSPAHHLLQVLRVPRALDLDLRGGAIDLRAGRRPSTARVRPWRPGRCTCS